MRREGFLEAAAPLKDCIASPRRLDTHDNPSQLLHDTVSWSSIHVVVKYVLLTAREHAPRGVMNAVRHPAFPPPFDCHALV